MKCTRIMLAVMLCLAMAVNCFADQVVTAKKVSRAPIIDGSGLDNVWAQAVEYVTYDEVAKVDVTLKAVYTGGEIFLLVSYPDSDKSDVHKTWVWDKGMEVYKIGPDREDCFVVKWNMESYPVDLSFKTDNEYMADVWFWKACRTDPVGFADDKFHRFSATEMRKSSKKTIPGSGKTMYLLRKGDSGTAAYKDVLYEDYKGDTLPRYSHETPTGSRADVRAKGVWSGGRWTVEFARALRTGNDDDVQFDTSKEYLFGVSRYEAAGRKIDFKIDTPLYSSGDVSEKLTLQFGE